jgi:hypothetical protein
MPKRKPSHGGRRKGAGRKPTGKPRKVTLAVRVAVEVREYLDGTGNRSATVEAAVRAYRLAALERDGKFVRLPDDAPAPQCED